MVTLVLAAHRKMVPTQSMTILGLNTCQDVHIVPVDSVREITLPEMMHVQLHVSC